MLNAQEKIEIERIDNLVRNFGWTKTAEELTGTHMILTFQKKRSPGQQTFGEGAD